MRVSAGGRVSTMNFSLIPGNALKNSLGTVGGFPASSSDNEAVMPTKFVCVQSRVDTGIAGGILFAGLSGVIGHLNIISKSDGVKVTGLISIHIVAPMRKNKLLPSCLSGAIEYEI